MDISDDYLSESTDLLKHAITELRDLIISNSPDNTINPDLVLEITEKHLFKIDHIRKFAKNFIDFFSDNEYKLWNKILHYTFVNSDVATLSKYDIARKTNIIIKEVISKLIRDYFYDTQYKINNVLIRQKIEELFDLYKDDYRHYTAISPIENLSFDPTKIVKSKTFEIKYLNEEEKEKWKQAYKNTSNWFNQLLEVPYIFHTIKIKYSEDIENLYENYYFDKFNIILSLLTENWVYTGRVITWEPKYLYDHGGFTGFETAHAIGQRDDDAKIENEEFDLFVKKLNNYDNLIEKTRTTPLWSRKFCESLSRTKSYDAFLDICICMESIFSTDKTAITYKITTRMSKILKTDYDERKDLKKRLTEMYDLRSKLVHGEEFGHLDWIIVFRLRKYVIRVISLIIDKYDGFPDWRSIKSQFNNEIDLKMP